MAQARMRPLVAGNWKMHLTHHEALALTRDLQQLLAQRFGTSADLPEIAICPPFTALAACAGQLAGDDRIQLGAQNCDWRDQGAYTGEVSVPMLKAHGCRFVIVGHSERRQWFGDDDEAVGRKTEAVLRHGLRPIVCVGETTGEREQGWTETVILRQLDAAIAQVAGDQWAQLVIAYEPVWAIGSGTPASPADAQGVAALIRGRLQERAGAAAAQIPILYGGSVKPDNARAFFEQPDVNGALVGGASLDAAAFTAIVAGAIVDG